MGETTQFINQPSQKYNIGIWGRRVLERTLGEPPWRAAGINSSRRSSLTEPLIRSKPPSAWRIC